MSEDKKEPVDTAYLIIPKDVEAERKKRRAKAHAIREQNTPGSTRREVH